MTLIRSISGIRGTIGGTPGEGLSPLDVVRYTAAFGQLMKKASGKAAPKAVIGRDARAKWAHGPPENLVRGTLVGLGFEVIDLGLATTPTVELAVAGEGADAGIILTASHNPKRWNALKLLNAKGEFISAEQGAEVLRLAESDAIEFSPWTSSAASGPMIAGRRSISRRILGLDLVDVEANQVTQLPRGGGCRKFRGRNGGAGAAESVGRGRNSEVVLRSHGEFPPQTRSRCRST